jgi:hypothetical protein
VRLLTHPGEEDRRPAGVTGGLLFTQQKAVTAGRSGDGFSQVTKPHMAHLSPRPKTYFPREKSRRWVEISDGFPKRTPSPEGAPERLIRSLRGARDLSPATCRVDGRSFYLHFRDMLGESRRSHG